jgi:hypothetical protein
LAGLAAIAGAPFLVTSAFGSDAEPDQLEDLFSPICKSKGGIMDRATEDLDRNELSLAEDFHAKPSARSSFVESQDRAHQLRRRRNDPAALRLRVGVRREVGDRVHRAGKTCALSESSFFQGPGNRLLEFCAQLGGEVMPSAGPSPWSRR